VAADVAKRAQLAVVVADDEDRLVADVRRQVRARAGEIGDVPGELPGALEDRALLELGDLRLEVQARLQRRPDRGGPGRRRGRGGTALGGRLDVASRHRSSTA
jgi:hypothetical protein